MFRLKVFVADIEVFVDMSLVDIEPNKRENPGLVTKGTSLLLSMLAFKYLCQMIKIAKLKAASLIEHLDYETLVNI